MAKVKVFWNILLVIALLCAIGAINGNAFATTVYEDSIAGSPNKIGDAHYPCCKHAKIQYSYIITDGGSHTAVLRFSYLNTSFVRDVYSSVGNPGFHISNEYEMEVNPKVQYYLKIWLIYGTYGFDWPATLRIRYSDDMPD
jgi:hypothetical protein